MESLILEGCELMDDNLFTNILSSLILSTNSSTKTIEDKQDCLLEDISIELNHFNRLSICQQCSHVYTNKFQKFKLKILNLSGCYRITDNGLK